MRSRGHDWSLMLAVLVLLTSCSSDRSYQRAAVQRAQTGVLAPFDADGIVASSPQVACMALMTCLRASSAEIIDWDIDNGLVIWRDTGSSFSPGPRDEGVQLVDPGTGFTAQGWNGYVFGCARAIPFNGRSWMWIRVRGRDREMVTCTYSDGTYERRLLRMTRERVACYNSGQETIPEFPARSPSSSSFPYVKGSLTITPATVQAAIEPLDLRRSDELWLACLDVLMQKGIPVRVDAANKLLVLLCQQLLTVAGSPTAGGPTTRPVRQDVVLVAHVRAGEGDTAYLYLGYVNDAGNLTRVPTQQGRPSDSAGPKLAGTHPIDIAAATICAHFEYQLVRQLNHRKLGEDLSGRSIAK